MVTVSSNTDHFLLDGLVGMCVIAYMSIIQVDSCLDEWQTLIHILQIIVLNLRKWILVCIFFFLLIIEFKS